LHAAVSFAGRSTPSSNYATTALKSQDIERHRPLGKGRAQAPISYLKAGAPGRTRTHNLLVRRADGSRPAAELMEEIRASGIVATAMGIRRTSLNDVFLRLTGAGVNGQNGR